MDLVTLDTQRAAESGAWCELHHPTTNEKLLGENGKPVAIMVVGTDSQQFVQARNRVGNKRLKKGIDKVTLDDADSENRDLVAACTLEFSNVVVDGKTLTYSRAEAKALYTRFPWIYEQVNAFMADRSNFLRESAKG